MNLLLGILSIEGSKIKSLKGSKMEKTRLEKKLTELLNSESREQDSDTPDFILAEFMMQCLDAFELANNKREVWYERESIT